MATLKYRLNRKNSSGSYDTIHYETSSNIVLRPSGRTVEQDLEAYLPRTQSTDDVPQSLTTGLIQVANSKVFCKLGNGTVRNLCQDTVYTHPATKQCKYTYTHPSTPQCNVSSRLDSIENKVNTATGVPRWYFETNSTWACPESGTYTFILVGGGQGWIHTDYGYSDGRCGKCTSVTRHANAGSYTITIGKAGSNDTNGRIDSDGGVTSITGSGFSISAAGGSSAAGTGAGNSGGYQAGTLIGSGTVGRGGIGQSYAPARVNAYKGAVAIY